MLLSKFRPTCGVLAIVVLALLASRSATADEPAASEPIASPPSLSGCWEGSWRSCTTGHHGKLRATITHVGDNRYCCRFRGTFFGIVPFKYSITLTAEPGDDVLTFFGKSNLGKLAGGVYTYTGHADHCSFHSQYKSCKDRGVFEMRRTATR